MAKGTNTSEPMSARDDREHYTWYALDALPTQSSLLLTLFVMPDSIVMGAGFSGMATAIQLKRKFGLEDVLV